MATQEFPITSEAQPRKGELHTIAIPFNAVSGEQGKLLDAIDSLRAQNIGTYVDLPQIIVCGDQSSGKSSVLEAISNINFPIDNGLCTRFAIELVLRRGPKVSIKATVRGQGENSSEHMRLLNASLQNITSVDISSVIRQVQDSLGLDMSRPEAAAHVPAVGGRLFSDIVLTITFTGPEQRNLTLIDLPGMIHATADSQSEEDTQLVQNLVDMYMKNPLSIIVVVVSAENDDSTQVVLQKAKQTHELRERTMGIITKPDTLADQSPRQTTFLTIARNKKYKFKHGWHVLRNRSFDKRFQSYEDRNSNEAEFFSGGVWADLPAEHLGAKALQVRISNLLHDHVVSKLPAILGQINEKAEACKDDLEQLGQPRGSQQEQLSHLIEIGQQFRHITRDALEGIYKSDIFTVLSTVDQVRLRAIVQEHLLAFAIDMESNGRSKLIVDDADWKDAVHGYPPYIKTSDMVRETQIKKQKNQGTELPGMYGPGFISGLFLDQSRNWKAIIGKHRRNICTAVKEFVEIVMRFIADDTLTDRIENEVLYPGLSRLEDLLIEKTKEILMPYQNSHAITYNRKFIVEVAANRSYSLRRRLLQNLPDINSAESNGTNPTLSHGWTTQDILIASRPEGLQHMEYDACLEALQNMEAYYEIALRVFIDNFATLCIESCLIEPLDRLLSARVLQQLDGNAIERIAGETHETTEKRTRLKNAVDMLNGAERTLRRLLVRRQ